MQPSILSDIAARVADAARRADYADIYMQAGASHAVLFEDGRMDTLSSSRSDGTGARVVQGDHTAYAHAPGVDAVSVERTLGDAAALSGVSFGPAGPACAESLLEPLAAVPTLDVGFFHDLDRALRAECGCLRQLTLRYRTSRKAILIVRGDGSIVRDERAYTTFAAQVVLERDGVLETGYEARSFLAGADDFWSLRDACTAEDIARRALARALLMLDAVPCPAGAMTVVLDGTAGGTMVHEACGHGLEADIVQKDYSVYRDRIGQTVADPRVTIVDDATLPSLYGSYAYDDEGTPAQRTVLVENGVLKAYLTDTLSARTGGIPQTGNGRRESYQHIPVPRMSNTFIAPGTTPDGELLAQVRSGLLVRKMGGGEVDPTSGDFVFHVSEGYLVEDGRIGPPVRGATLTGNGPEALCDIVGVGSELHFDPGTCGKSGQGVPVSDAQPTLVIRSLVVGGSDSGDGR